ncbi:MAG: DinB family protein [Bryobacteraceae bacterium]
MNKQLEATPAILRELLATVTGADTQWKPAPGRFSIAEVLEHLSHVEAHAYRLRIERMISEDNPEMEQYDQNAFYAAGQYSGRDAEDSFDHFEEQREDNLEFLRNLPPGSGSRTGTFPGFGSFTLDQLIYEWACHDLGHIRQISELIRALKYYPDLGIFQDYYKLNP